MKSYHTLEICLVIIVSALTIGSLITWVFYKKNSYPTASASYLDVPAKHIQTTATPVYQAKQFHVNGIGSLLTKKQMHEHAVLYQKYVDKRNTIAATLQSVDKNDVSKTYSPFRALKIAETYAANGQVLHELYFENLTSHPTTIGTLTKDLIQKSFGSFEAFEKDLLACASVARGWVVTAYSLDDGLLHNFVLEEHNSHVPVLALPLLVIDVYEHAYFIDYATNIKEYMSNLVKAIDWDIVEQRAIKWTKPFLKQ